MFRSLFTLLFLFAFSLLQSQDPTPPSDLEGQGLRTWLLENWYEPWHNDLGYSGARIEMFGTVDNVNGTIDCVYTGFSQAAESVTFPDPINTEHTIPQSFFDADLPMKSDLHHLFPTHQDANSRRGSLSFDEVVDASADEWLIENGSNGITQQGNIPSSNIDAYSEVHFNVDFEPREVQKGNTARAIFYFYTMYPQYLDVNGNLPENIGDLEQLFAWHVMDPPDAQEIERDERIQEAQGNYNPYIRQPYLVAVAWGFVTSLVEHNIDFRMYPNPANGTLSIRMPDAHGPTSSEVIDVLGNAIPVEPSSEGELDIADLRAGVYLLRVRTVNGVGVKRFVKE